ncbi:MULTISPECIES: hypothetical protein [unclassified Pseudomonas]|uniref:hypothetical protein n=1 Tax=unclassified Pseudomonas TaxID=196821 RepID=UPI000BE30E9D|nr:MULTISPECIES: hypothetical protein [unclassified Pseudomonas]
MSNNEMVSVPREVLVHMTNNQHKKVAAYMPDIADALRAVPPAGGEPLIHITPAVLSMLRGEVKTTPGGITFSLSEPIGGWTVPLYEQHVVTRLQAEVESQKKQATYNQETAMRWLAERDALKAEVARLKDKYQRDVFGLNNEGDPIGGEPAGGYANEVTRLQAGVELWKGRTTNLCIERNALQAELDALKAVQGEPVARKSDKWSKDWKEQGFNYCIETAIKALNYLADHPRPTGGESRYNAEHLIMTAQELMLTRQELLIGREQPAPVAVVLPERKKLTGNHLTDYGVKQWNACLDEVARLNSL